MHRIKRSNARHKSHVRPKALSAKDLFEKAQSSLDCDDFDKAKLYLKQAVDLEPKNLEYLDAYGALLAEVGPQEEALSVLKHAAELLPDQGFEKYMYLGQLTDGDEAVAYTRKGVEVIQRDIDAASLLSLPIGGLKSQLCRAWCALAERLMNSGADIAEVSEEVELSLSHAKEASPTSPEPLQALASLRYEQGRQDEALESLRQSMTFWFKKGVNKEDGEDDINEENDQKELDEEANLDSALDRSDEEMDGEIKKPIANYADDELNEPEYEFRFECAKLLLELDEGTDTVVEVLEDLLEENDQVLDVWHLLGLAYYGGGMYNEAKEIIQKGVTLMKAQGVAEEDEIVCQFAELNEVVTEALASQPSN